jgi:hypothetical protein
MANKKPKHEQRRSLISVRTTASKKALIRKTVKEYKNENVLTMSDMMVYAFDKLKGE